jgi:hypothetical protein
MTPALANVEPVTVILFVISFYIRCSVWSRTIVTATNNVPLLFVNVELEIVIVEGLLV